jgi:uroporphyrinogen decarboxylase
MKEFKGLQRTITPNWEGLRDNILRKGTPDRVYNMELFQDPQIRDAIAERYELIDDLAADDPHFEKKKYIAVQRFCGFDFVRVGLNVLDMDFRRDTVDDTAALRKEGGRNYMNEHVGPVTDWKSFDAYEWPDPTTAEATRDLEWYQANLPDDMCMVSGTMSHFCEFLTWLMGYESLCFALYDDRDLVKAISQKILEFHTEGMKTYLQFDGIKYIFASDDMGFKGGLLISANDMRELVLEGHRKMAAMAHEAGRVYLLHACGNLAEIYDDLIHTVKIDAKHSFEDTIEDVRRLKHTIGKDIALLGGIDVDFLCREGEDAIRERVRDTLATCQPGGGYCLGTGNSVANYIPLENYLAMLDEGRLFD